MTVDDTTPLLTVPVSLGDRSYDIFIGSGLLAEAGERLAGLAPGGRAMVVTDETVAERHLPALMAALESAKVPAEAFVVPAGEATKSFAELERLVDAVLTARLERGDTIVALGGGVVGDLAGFAAGIVRRGMAFVQIPTTLLAQVDSSVGGKTGINTAHGKNLVGVFHQPQFVLIDTDLLATLPPRHLKAGYAEVVKYGLIDDPVFFGWLEANAPAVFAGGPALAEAIAASCRAKARVVAADEREAGNRALLNLGHTFGHALEAAVGYGGDLVHGEAVAIGMAMAFRLSTLLGFCPAEDAVRVERHLHAVGLLADLTEVPATARDPARLLALMAQDKKVQRGALTLILTRGIGRSFIAHDVAADVIADFLEDETAR
ncbi:3-dehydroquinate synthase [Amorphus orientalis]|uniref:3-dehydroquinate synthase n=1 Tax=Amorphus orientalis TaxID=649198 RepID=A0AAE4ATU8_9HYPH|nr:3-dehydroquinate synthase [Amorphus orientalis]MDQ0316590.1 3-dehydroquinate synthase [Amorphus orientalis]